MVDYAKLNNMCEWEREKAMFLVKVAKDLDMDTEGYGIIDVNPNSGYTYLWLENYNFTLFMPINCDLVKNDVYALWTNSNNGDEIEKSLKEDTTLKELEEWTEKLERLVKR